MDEKAHVVVPLKIVEHVLPSVFGISSKARRLPRPRASSVHAGMSSTSSQAECSSAACRTKVRSFNVALLPIALG